MENLLTTKQVAAHYGVSQRTANHWCLRGYFPNAIQPIKTGKGSAWLVPESDLATFEKPTRGRPPKDGDGIDAS